MREVGPHVVHEGSGVGALAFTQAYMVQNVDGDWEFSDVGPADGWWVEDGNGDFEISTSSAGARSLLKVNGDYYIL